MCLPPCGCACMRVCALSSFRSLFLSLLPFSPSLYCSLSAAHSLLLSLCCCLLSLHLQRLRSRWLWGLLPLARLLVVSLCWFRSAQKQKTNEQEEEEAGAEEQEVVVWEKRKRNKGNLRSETETKTRLIDRSTVRIIKPSSGAYLMRYLQPFD